MAKKKAIKKREKNQSSKKKNTDKELKKKLLLEPVPLPINVLDEEDQKKEHKLRKFLEKERKKVIRKKEKKKKERKKGSPNELKDVIKKFSIKTKTESGIEELKNLPEKDHLKEKKPEHVKDLETPDPSFQKEKEQVIVNEIFKQIEEIIKLIKKKDYKKTKIIYDTIKEDYRELSEETKKLIYPELIEIIKNINDYLQSF